MHAHHATGHARKALVARQRNKDQVIETVIQTIVQTAVVLPDPTTDPDPFLELPSFTLPGLPFTLGLPSITPDTKTKGKPPATTTDPDTLSTTPLIIPTVAVPTTTSASTPTSISTPSSVPVAAPSPSSASLKLTPTIKPTTDAIPTSSRISSALPSASSAPAKSGSNTGAVGGGVFGALIAVGLFAAAILWVVRYYRKKAEMKEAFNASSFRRSALMLDDPVPPPKEYNIPPPMVQAPAVPPASFPYGEHAQHGADPYRQYAAGAQQYNISNYGADGQINRDPYAEAQYGGNLSGATYGQHASYASYGSPYHQGQRFSLPPEEYGQAPDNLSQHFPFPPQQYPSQTTSLRTQQSHTDLHNPFADAPPTTTAAAALAAARAAAKSPGPIAALSFSATPTPTEATFPAPVSPAPVSPTAASPQAGAPAVLSRKSTTSESVATAAYESGAQYADVQRDVKVAPSPVNGANGHEGAGGPSAAGPTVTAQTSAQRPNSMHSMMYEDADAYGGI